MRNLQTWEPYREQHGPCEAWGVRVRESGAVILPATRRLDAEDADLIARGHNARLRRPGEIWTESIVSSRTGRPGYRLQFGDYGVEMDLAALRAFILDLHALLEAGITDAFVAGWVQSRLMPDAPEAEQGRAVVGLLQDFRAFRELMNDPVEEAREQ